MVRLVLPAAAVLVLIAGCGGTREEEAPRTADAAAAGQPVAKAEPTKKPAKATKRRKGEPAPPAEPAIAQPEAPDLPAVDLATTPEMLSAHALVVAREQVQAELAGQADIAQRHAFILAAWQPRYEERLAVLREVAARRETRVQRGLADAKRDAEHERRLDAVDAEYEPRIRAEKAKTVPILDP